MSDEKQVIAICGSLRDESKTRVALQDALTAAREAGASTELVDLREYHLPAYGKNGGGKDAGDAPKLRQTADTADGILLGTPIYHGSYSSPLKTALDYCGRDEFAGTTVGMLAVAGGRFPTKGLEHLRNVCRHINAWVLPREVAIPNSKSTVCPGGVLDERIAERVNDLGREVVQYADVDRLPELTDQTKTAPKR